jgi:hypothetical protein
MNKRMREPFHTLMWKASIGYNDSWSQIDPEVLEKFAELIVKECISQARTQMHNDDEIASEEDPLMLKLSLASNVGVESAVEAIQKHFGVEE